MPEILRGALAALLVFGGCLFAKAHASDRPNILVIMADDLGFSDVGPFGGEISTPALDALAREGRLMTSMHVPAMPDIAHAEFLFGVDHHRIVLRGPTGFTQSSPPEAVKDLVSVAQALRDNGYRTHMIGTWDSGKDPALTPPAQGFDTSHALMSMAGDYFPPDGKNVPVEHESYRYMDNGRPAPIPAQYITDFWTDRLIADILADDGDGKPFFAYAAYTTPHFPLHAPDSFIAKYRGCYAAGYDAIRFERLARQKAEGLFPTAFEPAHPVSESLGYKTWENLSAEEKAFEARRMEVYAAMIENLDRNIGRLIAQLKAKGLYDNTLIIFTASSSGAQAVVPHRTADGIDNSIDNIGRKNSWISYTERWAEVSNAPFSRWKAKMTEGGTVVPFIVHLPGQKAARKNSDAMALMRDLPPTLLDFAGVSGDGTSLPFIGVSLKPLWEGAVTKAYARDHVFVDEYRDEAYVREGDWKAVLITDYPVNAYDGADAVVIDYLDAVKRGETERAEAIRAQRPPRWELFDIGKDRGETHDLARRNPDILARLIATFDEYRARYDIPAPFPE